MLCSAYSDLVVWFMALVSPQICSYNEISVLLVVSPRRGTFGLIHCKGTVIGPIVGGAFADSSATWRWGFYINLVVGAIFAPVYLFILPPFNPRPTESISSKVKDMDYLGAVLQAGAFVCGIMAINFGGTTYTWDSGQIIALFVVSGILFIIFGAQQTFNFWTSDNRMFPVHMLKMKEPVLLFIAMAACNAGSYVCMYYIPLYFQFIKGVDALDSGVRMLPFIIVGTLTILINGGVLSKTGFYMPWYVAGSTIVLIGGVLLCKSFPSPLPTPKPLVLFLTSSSPCRPRHLGS